MTPIAQTQVNVRLQLEGGLEVIEQALRLRGKLALQLSLPGWRRRLRKRLKLLQEVRAREGALADALERVERRARQEAWLEDHPVRGLIQTLERQENRLEALARRRLDALSIFSVGPGLGEALKALEFRALTVVAAPPVAGEAVLLAGQEDLDSLRWVWAVVLLVLAFPACYLLSHLMGLVSTSLIVLSMMAAFAMPVIGLVMVPVLRPPGRFWLTAERLVWKPSWGEPMQVKLSSIPAHGVSSSPHSPMFSPEEVSVAGGDREIILKGLPQAGQLWELLQSLVVSGALARRTSSQVNEVVVFKGVHIDKRFEVPQRTPGVVVLRSSYAAFLPASSGTDVPSLGGQEPSDVLLELLGRMRQVPDEHFDRFVEVALRERKGMHWEPGELSLELSPLPAPGARFSEREVHLRTHLHEVKGELRAGQRAVKALIFAQWGWRESGE
jgi:hypothetical protein